MEKQRLSPSQIEYLRKTFGVEQHQQNQAQTIQHVKEWLAKKAEEDKKVYLVGSDEAFMRAAQEGFMYWPDTQECIISTHDTALLSDYVKMYQLAPKAAIKMLLSYTHHELMQYIKATKYPLPKGEAEGLFVQTAPADILESYLLRFELKDEGELALTGRSHNLVMRYLQMHVFENPEAIYQLVRRDNLQEIQACCIRSALPTKAEIYIITEAPLVVRNYLLGRGHLSHDAELILATQGSDEDLRKYAIHWSMYPDSVGKVIKRGDSKAIIGCIRHCNIGFTSRNLEALLQRGVRKEIELYLSLHKPDVKIPD